MDPVTLQRISKIKPHPSKKEFHLWVSTAFEFFKIKGSVTIRLVDEPEIQALNKQYRHKDKPTDILSFDAAPELAKELPGFLGDLVICTPFVIEEAKLEGKKIEDHFAHLTLHGILHLLGYDHEQEPEATEMEDLEIQLLKKLEILNPYA